MATVDFTLKADTNLWGGVDYSNPGAAYLIASGGDPVSLDDTSDEYAYCIALGNLIPDVLGSPAGDFMADVTSGAAPLTVNFVAEYANADDYEWTFGPALATSTDQNPTYIYLVPGTYTVTLSTTNASEGDITTKTDYITVT